MSKKKRFNPIDAVYDNAEISAGTMISAGVVGKIGTALPSPLSGKILSGMEPMAMLPTIHATGSVFGALDDLNRRVKKK